MEKDQMNKEKSFEINDDHTKKILHLVVDSCAIIKFQNLSNIAKEYWTTLDVINEIRDKQARNFISRLPFELKIREPSQEAMNAIIQFSRKTGDFPSLSLTDLRILALTYMLEKEVCGSIEHLKTVENIDMINIEKKNKKQTVFKKHSKNFELKSNNKRDNKYNQKDEIENDNKNVDDNNYENINENINENGNENEFQNENINANNIGKLTENKNENENENENENNVINVTSNVNENENEVLKREENKILKEKIEQDTPVNIKPITTSSISSRILGKDAAMSYKYETCEDMEKDDKGWINNDNIDRYRDSPFGTGSSLEKIKDNEIAKVGCVTMDYAMQNILLRMGLHLISTNGMRVKTVKQWLLKCIACFNQIFDMNKVFCPKCGNNTLEKMSYIIDKMGRLKIFVKPRHKISLRGTKYSIPKSRGGREGDLLLREDQMLMGIWGQRKKTSCNKLTSAFGEDITYNLGINVLKENNLTVGYGHMNPNAQKGRKRGTKKK